MAQFSRRSLLKGAALPALGSVSAFSLPALAEAIQTNSTPYQRPKLKITDVRTAQVIVHGPQTHVRIYTDQGIYGQGECTDAAVGSASLIRGWRRMLVGRDPLDVEAIWERIRTRASSPEPKAGNTSRLCPDRDCFVGSCGQGPGMPVYQLMGGKFRDKVLIYCDSDMEVPIGQESDRKIPWIKAQGFKAMKIDLDDAGIRRAGILQLDGEQRRNRSHGEVGFECAREMPADMALACDMHGRYDAATGKKVAKELEPFKLMWLEEPVPAEDIDAMADIRHSTSTPIACGENVYMRWGYRRCSKKKPSTSSSPTFKKLAGLGEAKKVANMAQAYYVPVAPHCVVSPIGADGNLSLMRDISQFPLHGVALDQSPGRLGQLGERRPDHRGRLCHST